MINHTVPHDNTHLENNPCNLHFTTLITHSLPSGSWSPGAWKSTRTHVIGTPWTCENIRLSRSASVIEIGLLNETIKRGVPPSESFWVGETWVTWSKPMRYISSFVEKIPWMIGVIRRWTSVSHSIWFSSLRGMFGSMRERICFECYGV